MKTFANFAVLPASAKVLSANFSAGTRRACGLQQNAKGLFAKCSALSNSRKFSPAKVSGYTVLDESGLVHPAALGVAQPGYNTVPTIGIR